jgi:periplasmic divalent cation tolerance protein
MIQPCGSFYLMKAYVTIITTAGSAEEAQKIAQALVAGKKAACVQIFPVTNCYFWNEKIINDPEFMMFIKTQEFLYEDVEAIIRSLHSYEIPEIICLPILNGAVSYLDWISRVTA